MLAVLIVCAVLTVSVLAASASGPATSTTRKGDSARRARYLSNHPQDVNSGDISRMLSEADLSADQVARTKDGAAELGYTPFTMYAWIKKFDAYTLTQVIGERFTEHEALAHISDGTLPRLDTLGPFAHSHGIALQPRAQAEELRRQRSSRSSFAATATGTPSVSMPTLFAPGDWSMEIGRTAVRAEDPAPLELGDQRNTHLGREDGGQRAA